MSSNCICVGQHDREEGVFTYSMFDVRVKGVVSLLDSSLDDFGDSFTFPFHEKVAKINACRISTVWGNLRGNHKIVLLDLRYPMYK